MKVWILTNEVNDYNQYGEYFVTWWPEKPTAKQLADAGVDESELVHVLAGGGRHKPYKPTNETWWNLHEIAAGKGV